MNRTEITDAIARRVSKASRQMKYSLFFTSVGPTATDEILDIGIAPVEYSDADNFLEKHYPHLRQIVAITIDDPTLCSTRFPDVRVIRGDGTDLPFRSGSFDIVHSNAVIEHVGDWEKQRMFLAEAFRVAKKGFITTPNRYFPVESHTRIPLLHLLPKSWFDFLLIRLGKSWATGSYMRLLGKRDLRRLAAAAGIHGYAIHAIRVLGFSMAWILVWDKRDRCDIPEKSTAAAQQTRPQAHSRN